MKIIRHSKFNIYNYCMNQYTNTTFEGIESEIIKRLKPLNPNKIILFGSYAHGTPNKDSDIDLYVVTNDDFIPQSWREKMQLKLKFSKALRDIKQHYDIDLITHTKKCMKNL